MRQNVIDIDYKLDDPWVILSQIEQSIKRKIESVGTPLKEWDIKINRGILTGLNEAFIITKEKRDELVGKDPKSDEIIRPILRGRDIRKNSYEWAGLYIIATFPSRHYDIDDFPAVRDYLLTFDKRKLEQSGQKDIDGIKGNNARKKTNNRWFEVQDSIAYWDDFSQQKILFSEMVSSPQFYLDSQKFLVNDTVTFISGENLETLTIFLNSKIIFSIFKLFYAGGGLGNSGIRMKKTFLQKLPLPRVVIQNDNSKDQEILISQALTLTDAEFDYLLEAFSI
ncbi:TaqI-like C-terminal specificity domain-containing protein [Lactococcus lactis]|uniref:TaqI-like C-terminal specificity domain-containing protein n=1 Tax=Lactococcus lactis TaxID=1358 RepID=UPI00068D397A|nr:TaqI-like C-terminal specificity domain-containing protein [Lactococcus lactis]